MAEWCLPTMKHAQAFTCHMQTLTRGLSHAWEKTSERNKKLAVAKLPMLILEETVAAVLYTGARLPALCAGP